MGGVFDIVRSSRGLCFCVLACFSQMRDACGETVARLASDGRSFSISSPGLDGFSSNWSATVQTEGDSERVLKSGDGVVEPGELTTIRFPGEPIELIFKLETRANEPAVAVNVGIRNTGTAPVRLLATTPIRAEWKLPSDLNGWFLTGFHPATPMVQAIRDARQPVRIHEHGGCYQTGGDGFLFGPFGEPVADVDANFARLGEDRMYFNYGANMGGARVDPGETRWGQQVVLWIQPPREAFPRWADSIGKSHHARLSNPPLTGWGSWYSLAEKVTAKDVLNQVETVRRNPDHLRPDVMLIDKGHEVPGNFPEGLMPLASAAKGVGARPGLRLELNGMSDPCVAIRKAVGQGFSYLKLGDMQPRGQYRDPKLTEFEMRRKLYAAVREAAGPDVYLLNSPRDLDRAAVGFVDAARTGSTANRKNVVPVMNEVLRSYALNGRWSAIDNDHFYLGTDIANVSEIVGGWPVVRTWMSMAGMSCGAAFTSDPLDLGSVKPFWRNLEVMTPPARETTEVMDLGTAWKWPRLVGQLRRE